VDAVHGEPPVVVDRVATEALRLCDVRLAAGVARQDQLLAGLRDVEVLLERLRQRSKAKRVGGNEHP
jgi:hypothetical protein